MKRCLQPGSHHTQRLILITSLPLARQSRKRLSRMASRRRRAAKSESADHAPAATIEAAQIADFSAQPDSVQRLIRAALDLTKLNLTYTYGSDEPSSGGMDCSGTIYYLLRSQGFKDVPRDSSEQYIWARKHGQFFAVVSTEADGFEFKDLQPGDLMFWSGTYKTERTVPITPRHALSGAGKRERQTHHVRFQRWTQLPRNSALGGERLRFYDAQSESRYSREACEFCWLRAYPCSS